MIEEIINQREKLEQERVESMNDIVSILSTVKYDLNELSNFENPSVLVMGTDPYIPEAHILKVWAEKNKKKIEVTCIDKEENPEDFLKTFLKLENSEYFTINIHQLNFDEYSFNQKFNLILLLRQPTLSNISNDVYKQIPTALSNNGIFIMSGGYNDMLGGYKLEQLGMNIENSAQVPSSHTDFYKTYPGTNTVFKFRNNNDGV